MKKIVTIAIIVVLFLALAKGTLELISARTFQFYGNIVSRVETDQKVVALTFDDGPTENTATILEILEALDVKATFFLTGSQIEQFPEQARMLAESGHELGNHSYSHTRMAFKSPSFIREEVDRTTELIREAGYTGTIHFRPPYGKKLVLLPRHLKSLGMKTIMWDVEPESYPEIAASAGAITGYVTENVEPGSIILLHVMYESRVESVRAVRDIVNQLQSQGYEFLTVSELLAVGQ